MYHPLTQYRHALRAIAQGEADRRCTPQVAEYARALAYARLLKGLASLHRRETRWDHARQALLSHQLHHQLARREVS